MNSIKIISDVNNSIIKHKLNELCKAFGLCIEKDTIYITKGLYQREINEFINELRNFGIEYKIVNKKIRSDSKWQLKLLKMRKI